MFLTLRESRVYCICCVVKGFGVADYSLTLNALS